jgi:predicted dehydrogenase
MADWREAIALPGVDVVIVATTNDLLTPIARAALDAGRHVLVEKPAARSAAELESLAASASRGPGRVKVGFSLRFHPAIRRAKQIVDSGEAGPVMFVRARYGHGGRLGYDREWRADPAVSGGGELIDQGVHLVDLARWFLGDVTDVTGHAATFFWDMPVDDNTFLMLRHAGGRVAWLHASCTEWKNLFCLEVACRHAKIQVDGLGGSYGVERLTYYRMRPEMGPPDTTTEEFPGPDGSFAAEFAHFADAVAAGRAPEGGVADALAVLRVVDAVYGRNGGAT